MCYNVYLKINGADFENLTPPMEAFDTLKQPLFLIGESLVSSDENIDLYYMAKSTKLTVDLTEP